MAADQGTQETCAFVQIEARSGVMRGLEIPRLSSGGLIVNYRCSSRCGHCLYACSPQRSPDYLSREDALQFCERILELGCSSVHVGGGEPFLDVEGLIAVLDAAREVGMGIDYVETNASWFTGTPASMSKLEAVRDAGARTLLVSISPFHAAFIPVRKMEMLVHACDRAGVGVFPWMAHFLPELQRFDIDRPVALDQQEARHGAGYVQSLLQRYALVLGGRAVATFSPGMRRQSFEHLASRSRRTCRRLTDVNHFHVDLYGRYVPGLCAGLGVALDDMSGPLSPERYPLMVRLYSGGVGEAAKWASAQFGFAPRPEGYVHACEACLDLRLHLFRAGAELLELNPRGFYEDLLSE